MKFYKYRIGFVLIVAKILARLFHVEFPPVVSSAGIISKDGRVLFLDLSYMKGYGLPGGIIQAGETAEQALRREIHEETGLTVTTVKFLFSVFSSISKISTLSLVFEVQVQGDSTESEEGSLHWLRPEKAINSMAYASGNLILKDYIKRQAV